MPVYMFDTNMVSYFLKDHPLVRARVSSITTHQLRISAVTGGELLFGLANKPVAKKLHAGVKEFLRCVDVLPWDVVAMQHYGFLRARLKQQGITLGDLDMLIAAHALSTQSILVTHDAAFSRVQGLQIEDWTTAAV